MLLYFIPLYIAITLAIGFWASKKIKSSSDFMLAGKSLSTSFVGVTLFATWFGSSYIMGNPGHFVENGFTSFITLIFTNAICLGLVGYFYTRRLYRMNIITVSDFFRIRFNKKLEMVISILMILSYPHWIAAQFVALSYLFQNVLGIPTEYGVLFGAAIVIVYTYIGGMWAVSYTDMLQSIMILIGLFILLFNVLDQTDGIAPLFADKPKEFFNLIPRGGLTEWSDYIAILIAYGIGSIPVQEIYQRVFSAKSEKAAVNGVYLAAFLLVFLTSIPLVIALGAEFLHPELMGDDHGQNIIPSMVSLYASLPVQILFYGALISAILSTSSGAILAPATVIGENLLKPYVPNITDKQLLFWTRLSVIAVAGVSCFFAMIDADIVGLVVASLSLILVCVFAPFTFGLFWNKASVFGAWSAILVGGGTWLVCYLLDTQIDATIYGTPASCLAMVIGSLAYPDKVRFTNFSSKSDKEG
jgi:SSS family transporter